MFLTCTLLVNACASPDVPSSEAKPAVVRNLFGVRLAPPPMESERAAELAARTAEAAERLADRLGDEDATIWLGRRLAYEGKYTAAIDTFTRGLRVHPDSHRLLRHRGHRYITCRRFDLAVADLARASRLARGLPDAVEPDGQPNAAGIPRSTTKSNIEYHLGLAHYLLGEFDQAREAWERGLVHSRVNDDMLVATSWWLYLTLRRLGLDGEAREVLAPIHEGLEILENHAYHRLALMARGRLEPEAVLPQAAGSIQDATVLYGAAAWLRAEGHSTRAGALLTDIRRGTHWAAFGHLAAEADLWRESNQYPK
jgi:tetratricopeptide (TPR) repeat protein